MAEAARELIGAQEAYQQFRNFFRSYAGTYDANLMLSKSFDEFMNAFNACVEEYGEEIDNQQGREGIPIFNTDITKFSIQEGNIIADYFQDGE